MGDYSQGKEAILPEVATELRERFLSMMEIGMELDISIHPALLDDIYQIAKILGIDENLIPTERRLLLGT